ncbi:TIR domain-containing protein, partial [Halobellus sp. Atlit-31R]
MDQSVQAFKFWAFISYSHYDKKHARRLAQSLESLRVPTAHRAGVEGAPARFAPVFIDEDENAAHPSLSEELKAALRKSRKLVVLCSPFAANSPNVA